MSAALDFQSIIFKLQTYWAGQGCLIWQPYYSQVGAGTMNPATFLRVLGPEPWRVAYVEPSVRPDDGRYGINPNRLQQHTQFQVILKPDPGNPQELYLNSLLALGIDPAQHDIRFVEDNWESPALSAWGLGWEVWLDGQEITQFTYFQQAGGIVLDVPAVEITYGLERIAMSLQKVNHFKQIRWNESRTYGDVNQVAEREHSTYYYEVADVPNLRQMFSLFTKEAENALERGLVLPAYDNIIKCSHTFNILDARGAVGFTERQALFGKMRELSRKVAEAYYAQREEMGFPWMKGEQPSLVLEGESLPEISEERLDFLFEIGCEELPTADLDAAISNLEQLMKTLLSEARLGFDELSVHGTPRRLAVQIEALQTRQAERKLEVKGPPADKAFDAEGKPTKTAEGFARSRGVAVEQLEVRDFENGRYVVVEMQEAGKPTLEILAEVLPGIIANLRFTKSMRWNDSGVSFSRPIRWLVALLGETVVPFSYAGLKSGRVTHGLRFSQDSEKFLQSPADYPLFLQAQGIILDSAQRREAIWDQALALAEKVGGTLAEDPDLLVEVGNLVERPASLLGSFDSRYLQNLPAEVLISVMKKHQRYFPVINADGTLTNHFIIVRNGDLEHAETVVDGNLQVIHARFADAEFFIREDLQKKLADFVPELEQLTFQKQLGSMLGKTRRIQELSRKLGAELGLSEADQLAANRVAELCKADLASQMVVEMTSLQGIMGRYYAEKSGETLEVAQGIFEHYLPRTSEDRLPESWAGVCVGLADRLDSIAGLFGVGLAPTGNKDPFALRRSALGLAQLLIEKKIRFDVMDGLEAAADLQPVEVKPEVIGAAADFVAGRLHGLLLEKGFRYDVVDAVEQVNAGNPAVAAEQAGVLNTWVARDDWGTILPAYSRCLRMTRDLPQEFVVNGSLLVESEEKALFAGVQKAQESLKSEPTFENALGQIEQLVTVINGFFDKVLVMVEDEGLRSTRLGMLQTIAGLLKPFADISRLEGF
jgi:glycyl-tRNA synthetase